jgi:hypothetical protein
MKRFSLISVALLTLLSTLAVGVNVPQAARAMSVIAFRQARLAAKQLPAGFVLPSADADLKVSSLVAADLDADGDLDIVAAASANGPLGIVVWLNEGDGRLTRKRPDQPHSLGVEPPTPSVERHDSTVGASIQTDSPAEQSAAAGAWLVLPKHCCRMPLDASPISAAVATLRSRAPPALS